MSEKRVLDGANQFAWNNLFLSKNKQNVKTKNINNSETVHALAKMTINDYSIWHIFYFLKCASASSSHFSTFFEKKKIFE